MVAVLAPHPTPAPVPSRPALRVVAPRNDQLVGTRSRPVAIAPRLRPSAATYWRRRFVVLLAVTSLAMAVHVLTSSASAPGAVSVAAGPTAAPVAVAPEPIAATTADRDVYVVRPGDTMWSIASSLQPDGDVRALVDELTERADGPFLQAGQRIAIDGLGR